MWTTLHVRAISPSSALKSLSHTALLLLLIPRVESPSQKPSILYRNRTRNRPFFVNFRAELDLKAGSWDLRSEGFRT